MKNLNTVSTRGIEVGDLDIEEIEIKNVEAYQKLTQASMARKRPFKYHYTPRHRMVVLIY